MFKKMIPAALVVAAAPLLACGSAPTDEKSTSSSEALGRVAWSCAAGAHTQYGAWDGSSYVPGNWYNTYQSYFLDCTYWELFGDYNPSTGNVDAVMWVPEELLLDFWGTNNVCFPSQPPGPVTSSNPGGGGSKSCGPTDLADTTGFPGNACMTGGQLATALSTDVACSY